MSGAVSALALSALGDVRALDFYTQALLRAEQGAPPPYGRRSFGREFQRLSRDPSWFTLQLVSNADLEGYSARQLWIYADSVDDPAWARALRRHARDEAYHSRLFARMVFTLFPHLDSAQNRSTLARFAPTLDSSLSASDDTRTFEELLDSILLINLHEVKALVLERLLAPIVSAYAPVEQRASMERITSRLISDEIEHIRYTAQMIESAAAQGYGDYIAEALIDFQAVLNQVTDDELKG